MKVGAKLKYEGTGVDTNIAPQAVYSRSRLLYVLPLLTHRQSILDHVYSMCVASINTYPTRSL
jgi:hypothetical protein